VRSTLPFALGLLLLPRTLLAQPACLDTATLTVVVENRTTETNLEVTVDGELAPDAVACTGAGDTTYHAVLTCTGSGAIHCGQVSGLRPGAWVHRVSLTVPGSATQAQAQRFPLVGGSPLATSNALLWTAYPRTFVVPTPDGDVLWSTFKDAAEYTRCNPGPALLTFSPAAFPGKSDPQRILLVTPPTCALADRNNCAPFLAADTCALDGLPDGRTAGLCFTGDRIVVDALDQNADAGGVILSVGPCGRQVLRVYGSDDVFRGLVVEGSQKTDATGSCEVDAVSFSGGGARRNRLERSLVVGPTCGDAVSVDTNAGVADDGPGDNEVVDTRITGAAEKGMKASTGGVATIARSCVHDNREGGVQSTLGGSLVARENVVQHNVPGASQDGITVRGTTVRSFLATSGNVVRFAGGAGLSAADNADALFEHDYVSDSQFQGARIETTSMGPIDAVPAARLHGVTLVCNRHENLTGTCDPSPADGEKPCTTVEDCCTNPDGMVDPVCVAASRCAPGSFPRGFGAVIARAADHPTPAARLGDATLPGRNALSSNRNTAAGADLRVIDADTTISALGNQWEHCGTGAVCDVASVEANDISPADAAVDIGVPPGPRAGTPIVSHATPPRPVAGEIVRIYGDRFNAIEGNPFDTGNATPTCNTVVACAPDGSCPTGPCIAGTCPCSIESPLVEQRNLQTAANRIRIKKADGAVLATVYPDAVTPTMLAFRMPFDCFAPLTLEVAKRDPSGNRLMASTALCDPSGCTDAPADTPCDDGNACTLDDHCDGKGRCVAGAPRACASCYGCDPVAGCMPSPSNARCEDGDACTTADHCSGEGMCLGGVPVVCNGQCLTGACTPGVGCVAKPVGTACSDGDVCTLGDTCLGQGNVCVPGAPRDCSGSCLTGSCDAVSGCVVKPAGSVCRPAVDPCDLDDVCGGSDECPVLDQVKTGFAAVICAFDRPIDVPSCTGEAVPTKVTRLFRKAGAQVTEAGAATGNAKGLLCRARRRLIRALAAIDHAAVGRKPLSSACLADLRGVVSDARRRTEGTGVRCRAH
jgi:hypothetical protein